MRSRSFVVAVVLAAGPGCNLPDEKPPPPNCPRCGSVNTGTTGHLPPDNGMDGGVDGGATPDQPAVQLTGDVEVLDSIPTLYASTWVEPAEIVVEGRSGDVRGRWNGIDPFALTGVKRSAVVWADVTPGPGDALRTLLPLNTIPENGADVVNRTLTVVRTSQIELAFNVLSLPVSRDETLAQAVLVVQKGMQPAAGVSVRADTAEAVIYVENGTFTDTALATDASGIFLLANVPGNAVTVTLTGTVPGRWDLRLVSGGVTLAILGG